MHFYANLQKRIIKNSMRESRHGYRMMNFRPWQYIKWWGKIRQTKDGQVFIQKVHCRESCRASIMQLFHTESGKIKVG